MRSRRDSEFRARMLATGLITAAVLSGCGSDSTVPTHVDRTPPIARLFNLAGTLSTGAIAGVGALPTSAASTLAGLSASRGGGTLQQMLFHSPSRAIPSARGDSFSHRLRTKPPRPRTQGGTRVAQGDVIDNASYGHSYAYDVETQQYVDDGLNTGPSDGVSFTLYEVDGDGGFTLPLTVTGTLAIHDLSDATTNRVGIKLNGPAGEILADYDVTVASFDAETFTYSVSSGGRVSDGLTEYTFTYAETATSVNDYTDDVTFSGDGLSLSDHFAVDSNEQTGGSDYDIDVTLSVDGESVRLAGGFTVSATPQSEPSNIDLLVYVNGDVYAQATTVDTDGHLVFLKGDGTPVIGEDYTFLSDLLSTSIAILGATYQLVYFALLMLA